MSGYTIITLLPLLFDRILRGMPPLLLTAADKVE
jgi:hypothetical protein